MFEIISKIRAAFDQNAAKDKLSGDVLFDVRTQIFQALHICLNDLVLDGHIENDRITDCLNEDALDVSRNDITPAFFTQQLMSVESKEQAIEENCAQFYVESLVQYIGQDSEVTQRLLNGEDDAISALNNETIDAINDDLAHVNDQLHEQFCAYMGYTPSEMGYDEIYQAVHFAIDNNMMDGKSLENWFPVAYANMPRVEDQLNDQVNNKAENDIASPRP